ncbi:glucokinase [Parasphingorhabdus sp.]|jgi:glucokinase|uniref:glucokinase n=1 Tax=Parasphingorhabdus sp. TaxID=2709688 RepID=UPI0030012990
MNEIVVADVGGTHARFAIAEIEHGKILSLSSPVTLATADHPSFQIAWEIFGEQIGRDLPRAAAIAIAAPIRTDLIKLTNNPWIVRPSQIPEKLGVDRHILINDFAAVAHAVALVDEDQLMHISGPDLPLPRNGVISVIGPGTGLGVAALVINDGRTQVLPSEGGRCDFAPLDAVEDRILQNLRAKHGRVAVERVVAGPGLRAIFEVLCEMEGRAMPLGNDKALWSMALAGENSIAIAALDRFLQALGAVAGDISLTHGPGPVVLAGGLGLRLAKHINKSGFADRFVSKGRYRGLMESLPVKLITHPEPGLLGAAAAFAIEYPN